MKDGGDNSLRKQVSLECLEVTEQPHQAHTLQLWPSYDTDPANTKVNTKSSTNANKRDSHLLPKRVPQNPPTLGADSRVSTALTLSGELVPLSRLPSPFTVFRNFLQKIFQ